MRAECRCLPGAASPRPVCPKGDFHPRDDRGPGAVCADCYHARACHEGAATGS